MEKGYGAMYSRERFGHGLTPDHFAGYKKQRFRWAYGAMQIMKAHAGKMLSNSTRLSFWQKYHFISGWTPWFADALNLIFTWAGLAWVLAVILPPFFGIKPVGLPPAEFILPTIGIFVFKLCYSFGLYADRVRCNFRQSIGASLAGLALTYTVGRAVLYGLATSRLPFMRTPKMDERATLGMALGMARGEAVLTVLLWLAALVLWNGTGAINPEARLWSAFMVVQSLPFAAAVLVSWSMRWSRCDMPAPCSKPRRRPCRRVLRCNPRSSVTRLWPTRDCIFYIRTFNGRGGDGLSDSVDGWRRLVGADRGARADRALQPEHDRPRGAGGFRPCRRQLGRQRGAGRAGRDLALKDLLGYFQDEAMRRSLFSPSPNWLYRWLNRHIGIGPAYSTEHKLQVLTQHLPKTGGKTLYEAARGLGRRAASGTDIHLLIIGFNYDASRAAFFRSRPTKGPGWGAGGQSGVTLAEAVHASTNAPVNYFDGPAVLPSGGGRFWDGGITGCNNPALAAVTEAIGRGQTPTDIVVLSLGTGTVALPPRDPKDPPNSPFVQSPSKTGLLADLRRLATSIMDDPPDVATFLPMS